MTATPDWFDRKACTSADAGLFWPAGIGSTAPDFGPALSICARCPVMAECRADAIAHGDIVDGYATHGQVVGGCAPKPKRPGARPAVMLPCSLEGCVRLFPSRGRGANMYCSIECAAAGRRDSNARYARRRRWAS